MLIKSFNQGFQPSLVLLCIALIKKVSNFNSFNYDEINEEIDKYNDTTETLKMKIQHQIFCLKLHDVNIYNEIYNYCKEIEFLYDVILHPIVSNKIGIRDKNDLQLGIKLPPSISSQFYEGFGIEI